MFSTGQMRLQPVYVEDVGQSIAKMLQRAQTHPITFECGGPRVYSYEEFLRTVASAVGIKPILLPARGRGGGVFRVRDDQVCRRLRGRARRAGFVFSAGIGEHSAPVRAALCAKLAWLGVKLDKQANTSGGPRISAPDSGVSVWSIPTNEELMIAQHTLALVRP
jgi:hypothetical protein